MKKVIFLILILALGYYAFFMRDDKVDVNTNDNTTGETFRPDPSNATFAFDEGPITLSQGRSESDNEEVSILDDRAFGDINADGKEDSVILLARSGGGSGVFVYAAAYLSGPVNYKGTNAVFLGDRIAPQSISIANGAVTVRFLDRRDDEPYAAEPTVPTAKVFVYQGGELVEK